MHGAHPDIFLTLPKTFSSLDPFYQGHMQLLPNTTSQRQLTFLLFTCSPGSQLKNSSHRPQRRGKSDRKDATSRWTGGGYTGKGWPQFCVFWVLPQLYLVQQNTSHIEGSYVDRQGKTLLHNLLLYTICFLLAIKFYCKQLDFSTVIKITPGKLTMITGSARSPKIVHHIISLILIFTFFSMV